MDPELLIVVFGLILGFLLSTIPLLPEPFQTLTFLGSGVVICGCFVYRY